MDSGGGGPKEVCSVSTAIPLLGATAVAIMAFGGDRDLSDDSTGEFCRSLFQVVFLSLGPELGDRR